MLTLSRTYGRSCRPAARARRVAALGLLFAGAALASLSSSAHASSCSSVNASNFNGTPIPGGDTVWFNAIAAVKGIDPQTTSSVTFSNSSVAFTAGGTSYQLAVPDGTITFSPAASTASTTYDSASSSWLTTVPARYSGNVFLSGLAFPVPATGLPGGTNPVTWSGRFTSATPGLKVQWQWGAAVYTQFATDYNADGVKPLDGDKLSAYPNSDHAGTPESDRPFVIGGARGGGGSNFTGSYSGTAAVVPCQGATQLTMQKVFASSVVHFFQSSSFAISVTNAGSQTSQNLEIADLLDSSLQLLDANVTQGGGTCTTSGQAVSCQFPALAPGETVEITVDFLAVGGPTCMLSGCVVNNTATASDAGGDTASANASVIVIANE